MTKKEFIELCESCDPGWQKRLKVTTLTKSTRRGYEIMLDYGMWGGLISRVICSVNRGNSPGAAASVDRRAVDAVAKYAKWLAEWKQAKGVS